MHLVSVSRMINLFAATGHINYAKSSRLYLQLMYQLPTEHPWLYRCFIEQGFHVVRRTSRYWAGLWTDLIIEQVMMRSIKSRGGITRGRGITETVRLQWIYSMHKCAGIHNAMTTITNSEHRTSEQHVDLGTSRSNRDFRDLSKIQEWFNHHKLRSLSSGLTATDGDGINCHNTEEVGRKIQKHLDNISVLEASIKKSEQVKSLNHLYPRIQVDKEKVQINPTLLFSRLIAIVQREEDMIPYFDYELTAIPTSLFKDHAMRKTTKAQLAKALMSNVQPSQRNTQIHHVLDGGALIHRVKWPKGATYSEIAKTYVSYVHQHYGHSCIIFDGYKQGPSIKDHEHQRRLKKTCADIQLGEFMQAHHNQQIFLSNENNKNQFILLLSKHLEADGNIADGDADTMIVTCVLQYAGQESEVNVVADDTDVLVLLMYHWKHNMADVYFLSEVKKNMMVWKIHDLVIKAGEIITSHLLFLHAWSGCDTTSATFGHGITSLLKRIKECKEIQQISSLMSEYSATAEQISKAGTRLFVITYGGKQEDSLNSLRYIKFMEMVSSSKASLDPQKLSPTERAAHFHSLRVHLQVIIWKKLSNNSLNPKQWGWKLEGSAFTSTMTDLNAAPDNLLKFVRCKCNGVNVSCHPKILVAPTCAPVVKMD